MTTMNISLPDDMKAWIDKQVERRGFMSASEFIRELIRHEKELDAFRQMLTEAEPTPLEEFDDAYFASLRARVAVRA